MSDTVCPRCGSPMQTGGVCPVCEIPHGADDGALVVPAVPESPAPSAIGRLWQSGRLAAAIAALCFVVGSLLPLVTVSRMDQLGPTVSKNALDLISAEPPYGRELKSMTALAIPGAAALLVSLLASRKTRAQMFATRPLLVAIAILPLVAAALTPLRIARHRRMDFRIGPAVAFIAAGSVFAMIGASRFGRGCSDPPPRGHEDDED